MKDHFLEYYFKDTIEKFGNFDKVEVTKFEGNKKPSQIYTIKVRKKDGKPMSCNCPGAYRSKGNCKHLGMVADWIKAGRPVPEWMDYIEVMYLIVFGVVNKSM